MMKTEELELTQEWDKVFPASDKVDHEKVTFANRFGITLAADLYRPKGAEGLLPALAISGPFGAVKCLPVSSTGTSVIKKRLLEVPMTYRVAFCHVDKCRS